MTEAVQKEIQNRTPYRLARGTDADTRLTGRIVQVRKGLIELTDDRDLALVRSAELARSMHKRLQ